MNDETMEVKTAAGKPWRVNRAKFEAMRRALMTVLPAGPPGLTVPAATEALMPHLDPALFPGGEKAGWWLKAVQLDHEYRGLIAREKSRPVKLYRP